MRETSRRRAAGVGAATVAIVLAVVVVTPPATASVASPTRGDGAVAPVVVPPRDASAPRPAVVYLHGMCGEPANGCSWFADGATPFGWLVCPRANGACASGGAGASWTGSLGDRRDAV